MKTQKSETQVFVNGIYFWMTILTCWLVIIYFYIVALRTYGTEYVCFLLGATILIPSLFIAFKKLDKLIYILWSIAVNLPFLGIVIDQNAGMQERICVLPFSIIALISSIMLIRFRAKRTVLYVLHFLLVGSLLILNTTVPSGNFMFTKEEGKKYVPETRFFVPPSLHIQPLEVAPPLSGTLQIKEIPDAWTIEVTYQVKDVTILEKDLHSLLMLQTVLHNGIRIPSKFYDESSDTVSNNIEMYFREKYTFLKTTVHTTYTKVKVWDKV